MSASEAIRQYRSDAKVTQIDLASALGVAQSTVASWETGHRPVGSEIVGRVSHHTGIALHVLRPDLFPAAA